MLNRLSGEGMGSVQLVETEDETPEKNFSLHLKYQTQPFLYKLLLKIRSIFAGRNPESLFNDDVLLKLAKAVNRDHPGLLNPKMYYLDNIFYDRLKDLKDSADFFKPYFAPLDENSGDFFVFLSSFVSPEISEKINAEADPFSLSFDVEPTQIEKDRMLKNLDNILTNLDGQSKSKLFEAVLAVSWLKRFSVLPFIHFSSQFTNLSGTGYTCPYKNACIDFEIFAALFSNLKTISSEVLESLFLYTHKNEFMANPQNQDLERSAKEFMAAANAKLSAIQMFISGVPVVKMGKIISQDYDWKPGNFEGIEGWFPKFRSHWREIIEIRWAEWVKERKKSKMMATLHTDFGMLDFPEIQYHPWTNLWSQPRFACELTGGFLSWYCNEQYHKALPFLNDILLEGVFNGSQNRIEYTTGFNVFQQANQKMADLLSALAPGGDYGIRFAEWSKFPVGTVQMQNQIKTVIGKIEAEVRSVLRDFMAGSTVLVKFLSKLLSSDPKASMELMQNFNSIKGRGNREWKDNLEKVQTTLSKCVYYLSELEPIDLGL